MRFGPPREQPGLSPWRWRGDPWAILSSLALVQLVFAFVPLGVVVLYVGAHHHDAGPTVAAHTFNDDLDTGPLLVMFALTAMLLTGGDAAYTLARDLVMVVLAAIVVTAILLHPHTALDENRWMQWPVLSLLVVTVAQLGIDLVRLRPVFVALRARRLPRATVRR